MSVRRWKRTDPTSSVVAGYKTIVIKTFGMPDNTVRDYATLYREGSRCGAVIALTSDNLVVLAKQFRPGPEKIMWEIPGGGLEPGEDPKYGAMRELREETGYTSDDVRFLGTSSRDGYSNAVWYYYIAYNCYESGSGQELDDNEYVDVELHDIATFLSMSKQDMLSDAHAVLMAYDELQQLL